jgi:hypothetical protein
MKCIIPIYMKVPLALFLENHVTIKPNIINILQDLLTLFQGWHCVCIHKVEVIENLNRKERGNQLC